MTNHPIERLRNKLSPFLTVVDMLADVQEKNLFGDEKLNATFEKTLKQCLANKVEIEQNLQKAEALIPLDIKEEPQ